MKDDLFAELVASVREGGAILSGDQPASRVFAIQPPDIKAIRDGFSLTQEQFAALLGISVRTLRNWEQGRRVPEGPARFFAPSSRQTPGSCTGCSPGKFSMTIGCQYQHVNAPSIFPLTNPPHDLLISAALCAVLDEISGVLVNLQLSLA